MSVSRLHHIPGFSIDRVAAAAEGDPDVLRLENLDTDLAPPAAAIEATRLALEQDGANSYLPFAGQEALRMEVARHVGQLSGLTYTPSQVVITCGGTEGMLNALLATTNPGDEVVLTDPTYAGMINRVRLAGAVPVLVPFVVESGKFCLDLAALEAAVTPKTRALFIMNPSMPSGAVLNHEAWELVARLCRENDLWLIYNAAMERLLFDGHPYMHPASLRGMAHRTITVGSVSKEYRMIGWRVGWVVGPHSLIDDIARVSIYNAVTPTGIAQPGAAAALAETGEHLAEAVGIWQARRDEVCRQLSDYRMIPAAGGWSQLLDTRPLGMNAATLSERLLAKAKVAATPMDGWGGSNCAHYLRLVFSNESVSRLAGLRERFALALV